MGASFLFSLQLIDKYVRTLLLFCFLIPLLNYLLYNSANIRRKTIRFPAIVLDFQKKEPNEIMFIISQIGHIMMAFSALRPSHFGLVNDSYHQSPRNNWPRKRNSFQPLSKVKSED